MTDVVDAVAQAIFAERVNGNRRWETAWEILTPEERDHYRRMARAAIGALGLKTEWGWQLGDNTPSVYPTEQQARDRVTYLDTVFQVGTKRHVVHRLTTPWTRDTTDAPART